MCVVAALYVCVGGLFVCGCFICVRFASFVCGVLCLCAEQYVCVMYFVCA